MIQRCELPNGTRVVSERMVGVPSLTLGIWVENGSRFERAEQGGISHFLEHLLFKGTGRRSAIEIAQEIDAIGGVLNAFTGKEYTCYYVRVLSEHTDIATDLLGDLFLHSRLDEAEIERERGVVLQEIAQTEDTPDDYVHELFNLRYWDGHPLSLPVCGNADSVGSFGRQHFVDFMAARYRPDRVIVAAAGDVDHAALVGWVEREFGALTGSAELTDGNGPPLERCGTAVFEKPLEQVHVCMGTPGLPLVSEDRFAAYILNVALGGGMSSRLFQEIRERRGRAYSVFSFLSSYRDAGYFGVYVATSAEWAEEVIVLVLQEMRSVAREGLAADELQRTKNQLKGNMLLGLESSENRMNRLAKNELYFRRDFPIPEVAAAIDATTNDQVVELAERLLRPQQTGVVLLGDLGGRRIDESILGERPVP